MLNHFSPPRTVSRRVTVVGVAMIAALAFAGIAAGSASALSISPSPAPSTFKSNSLVSWTDAAGNKYSCEGITGNGTFSSASAGTYSLSFNNCNGGLGGVCTTSGQPTGVIKSKPLTINLEYLNAEKTKFAIGFKPTASDNVFAEYNCGYSGSWTGGVIGQVTSPGLNSPQSEWTVEFAHGTNEYQPKYQYLLPTLEWLESGGTKGWYYDYSMQQHTSTTRAMAITATNKMSFGGVPTKAIP